MNRDLLQHNLEFNQIVLRSEVLNMWSDSKSRERWKLGVYDAMMQEAEKKNGYKPSIGSMLQMDSKLLHVLV